MEIILNSIEPVVNSSKHVRIQEDSIKQFLSIVNWSILERKSILSGLEFRDLDEKLNFYFLFNLINFAYWGFPDWNVEHEGKKFFRTGALLQALKNEAESNPYFVSAESMMNLTKDEFVRILGGENSLVLIPERVKNINEGGRILNRNYKGKFINFVKDIAPDTDAILGELTKWEAFDDKAIYNNHEVYFYKRAQVLTSGLDLLGIPEYELSGLDKLTAFADYRLPQIFRHLGILKYSEDLESVVDSENELEKNSEMEVEIRANSVWAVEILKNKIKETKNIELTSSLIDNFIWNYSHNLGEEMKPHHKTYTTSY